MTDWKITYVILSCVIIISLHGQRNINITLAAYSEKRNVTVECASVCPPVCLPRLHTHCTGGSEGAGGHGPPGHVGKRPECTKSRHFQTQNGKNFWGGGNAPPQTPASFPLHKSQRSFQHACFAA